MLKDVGADELASAVRKAAQGARHPAHAPLANLSEREFEVLRLIAAGYSNSEIAEQLVISGNTVKSHVSNILSKLRLADRTQAAIYAWREGIIQE
jgi:two-component system, NarL family, response regulator LiaR